MLGGNCLIFHFWPPDNTPRVVGAVLAMAMVLLNSLLAAGLVAALVLPEGVAEAH